MALSTKENTSKEVMENFKISGLSPDYINIFRLEFLNNGQIITDLKVYGDENARNENPDSQIKVIGTNVLIPKSLQDEIKTDLFGKIYPYLEKMYEVRALLKDRDEKVNLADESDKEALLQSYELKIRDIYIENGLDSPF